MNFVPFTLAATSIIIFIIPKDCPAESGLLKPGTCTYPKEALPIMNPHKKICFAPLIALAGFLSMACLVLWGRADALNASFYALVAPLIRPSLTRCMVFISLLGEWFGYAPVIALLLALPKTRKSAGLPLAATMTGTVLLNQVLKRLFRIPRPALHRLADASGYSFPSGHSMGAMTFALVCILLLFRSSAPAAGKILGSLLALSFALLMGFSRVYLGVHTVSDVLAGYFLSLAIAAAYAHQSRLKEAPCPRGSRSQPYSK